MIELSFGFCKLRGSPLGFFRHYEIFPESENFQLFFQIGFWDVSSIFDAVILIEIFYNSVPSLLENHLRLNLVKTEQSRLQISMDNFNKFK